MKSSNYRLPTAATILDVQTENYRTKTLVLDANMPADPGQFIMLWLPGFDEKPFSLVNNDPVTLMITVAGPFSHLVHEKRPGDQLWLRGPFGHGFSLPEDKHHALLVGGGYGVAPLLWLARRLSGSISRVTTVIGARTRTEVLYLDEFQALCTDPASGTHHALHVTSDDDTVGQKGLVTDAVGKLLTEDDIDCIFACGPHPMLAALRLLAKTHAIPCQLSWEAYMRCGMGLCGSCEFEGAVLCMDGPVLAFKP
jgi:dihydroorotate dehydrogenase electron transfer subunit